MALVPLSHTQTGFRCNSADEGHIGVSDTIDVLNRKYPEPNVCRLRCSQLVQREEKPDIHAVAYYDTSRVPILRLVQELILCKATRRIRNHHDRKFHPHPLCSSPTFDQLRVAITCWQT